MRKNPRSAHSLFFAALVLAGALICVAAAPRSDAEPETRLAQSTSAILEDRAA